MSLLWQKAIMSRPAKLLIQLIVVLSACAGLYAIYDTNRTSKCQARYNTINNDRTRALYESSQDVRNANADVIFTQGQYLASVASYQADPSSEELQHLLVTFEKMREAIHIYGIAAEAYDVDLSTHPIPPPPTELCG